MEEIKWLNVQNVDQWFHRLRRNGQWQDAQTRQERECNWKSAYSRALRVTPLEKSSARRRFKETEQRETLDLSPFPPIFPFLRSAKFYNVAV